MLTEFSVLATTFIVSVILIPFGIAVLIFGFFTKRKKTAWFGFSSIVLAVPVLLVILFIGAVRGLNTAVNVASNTGGKLIEDLKKNAPTGTPADSNDTDDVDDDTDDKDVKQDNKDVPAGKSAPGTTTEPDSADAPRETAFALRVRNLYERLVQGRQASIVTAREFAAKGVRFGTLETRADTTKDAKDAGFTISVYMIFDRDYASTVRMRALDSDGREMGRVSLALDEKQGAARYVDFKFDRRLNPAKLRFGVLDAPGFQDPFPRD